MDVSATASASISTAPFISATAIQESILDMTKNIREYLFKGLETDTLKQSSLLSMQKVCALTENLQPLVERLNTTLAHELELFPDQHAALKKLKGKKHTFIPTEMVERLSEQTSVTSSLKQEPLFKPSIKQKPLEKLAASYKKKFNKRDAIKREVFLRIEALREYAHKKGEGIPAIRRALFNIFSLFNDDLPIQQKTLEALCEVVVWDSLEKESAHKLPELLIDLANELELSRFQTYSPDVQTLLMSTLGYTGFIILLHQKKKPANLNAIGDEAIEKILSRLNVLKKINSSQNPDYRFSLDFCIQGIKRIDTNGDRIKEILAVITAIATTGFTLASVYENPSEGIPATIRAFNYLYELIGKIELKSDWFEKVQILERMCRIAYCDPFLFRKVSTLIKQLEDLKGNQTIEYQVDNLINSDENRKHLKFGIITILEKCVLATPNEEIAQDCLKLLLYYFFHEEVEVKQRLAAAFNRIIEGDNPRLSQTAYALIKLLEASGYVPLNPLLGENVLEKEVIYENVIKFLLRNIAEIKSTFDLSEHSLVTMLCISEEKERVPPLLRMLRKICPQFQEPDHWGRTPYHILVQEGHYGMLKSIRAELETNIDEQEQEYSNTALHLAVKQRSADGVSTLLSLEARQDAQNDHGETPLHLAISDDWNGVELLLYRSIESINLMNDDGKTALNLAIENDLPNCTERLIKAGGRIAEECQNITPLMLAAKRGAKNCLKLLINQREGNLSRQEAAEIQRLVSCVESGELDEEQFVPFHKQKINESADYGFHFSSEDLPHPAANSPLLKNAKSEETVSDLKRLLESVSCKKNEQDPLGRNPLHVAVLNGNHDGLFTMLASDFPVDVEDTFGFTPLQLAVFVGDPLCVKTLLENKADPNKANMFGDSALLIASGTPPLNYPKTLYAEHQEPPERNKLEILELLAAHGAKVACADRSGNTPLHRAMLYNHNAVVQWIINNQKELMWQKNYRGLIPIDAAKKAKRSIDLDGFWRNNPREIQEKLQSLTAGKVTLANMLAMSRTLEAFQSLASHIPELATRPEESKHKKTSLHIAAETGKVDIIKVWTKANLDLNVRDALLNTALHLSAREGKLEFLQACVESGADICLKNKAGQTPLHIATAHNQLEAVKLLVAANAKLPLMTDNHGDTPLHVACRAGDKSMVSALYQENIPSNDDGNTPLHTAAMSGNDDAISILMGKGENLEARNTSRQTPLILGALQGNRRVVEKLVSFGANCRAQDDQGETALHKAVFKLHVETVQVLLNRDDQLISRKEDRQIVIRDAMKQDVLSELARREFQEGDTASLEILRMLIKAGAKPDVGDKGGENFLHAAAYHGRTDLLRELLQLKKSTDLATKDFQDNSLLHKSVEGNRPEMLLWLIQQNTLDINEKNKEGITPLHLAVQKGYWDVAGLLLHHGANPKMQDNEGRTLLHVFFARETINQGGAVFLAYLILARPSILYIRDDKNWTPFHSLAHYGHFNCLFILKYLPETKKKSILFRLKRRMLGIDNQKRENYFNALNSEGKSAEHLADRYQEDEMRTVGKIRNFPKTFLGKSYRGKQTVNWLDETLKSKTEFSIPSNV